MKATGLLMASLGCKVPLPKTKQANCGDMCLKSQYSGDREERVAAGLTTDAVQSEGGFKHLCMHQV